MYSVQFPGSRKWNPIWSARDAVSAIGSARIEISIGELKMFVGSVYTPVKKLLRGIFGTGRKAAKLRMK
jgi:hypothetical protein